MTAEEAKAYLKNHVCIPLPNNRNIIIVEDYGEKGKGNQGEEGSTITA